MVQRAPLPYPTPAMAAAAAVADGAAAFAVLLVAASPQRLWPELNLACLPHFFVCSPSLVLPRSGAPLTNDLPKYGSEAVDTKVLAILRWVLPAGAGAGACAGEQLLCAAFCRSLAALGWVLAGAGPAAGAGLGAGGVGCYLATLPRRPPPRGLLPGVVGLGDPFLGEVCCVSFL